MSDQILFTAKQSVIKVYVCRDFVTDPNTIEQDILLAQGIAMDIVTRGCTPIIPCMYFPQFLDAADPDHLAVATTMMIDLMQPCDYFVIDKNSSSSPASMQQKMAANHLFPASTICESVEDFLSIIEGFRKSQVESVKEDILPVADSEEVADD